MNPSLASWRLRVRCTPVSILRPDYLTADVFASSSPIRKQLKQPASQQEPNRLKAFLNQLTSRHPAWSRSDLAVPDYILRDDSAIEGVTEVCDNAACDTLNC